jgi:Zn-dependent protease
LTHSAKLESLAAQAQSATAAGDLTAALESWRLALELLPRDSKQFGIISAQVSQLGQRLPHSTAPQSSASSESRSVSGAKKAGLATGLGALGLFVWKFKILLAGLTKSTTLFSMFASLGVYWTIWGWRFALGLVLSIYIHEMGHIIQLRRYGFRTGVPTFIPGLGALIRMQQQVVNPREDADIGLAGPIYGLGAAVVAMGLWKATGLPIFAAIAGVGAWINLFNLLPFGSLDGGRGFHAMSRYQKIAATVCVAAAWYFAGDGMLVLLFIGCVAQVLAHKSKEPGYPKAAWTYCVLVIVLTAISMIRFLAEIK